MECLSDTRAAANRRKYFYEFAWYGYLKYKASPLWLVIAVSWGIAFFEYCLQLPANRMGNAVYCATAQRSSGNHYAGDIRRVLYLVFRRTNQMESFCRFCIDSCRCNTDILGMKQPIWYSTKHLAPPRTFLLGVKTSALYVRFYPNSPILKQILSKQWDPWKKILPLSFFSYRYSWARTFMHSHHQTNGDWSKEPGRWSATH